MPSRIGRLGFLNVGCLSNSGMQSIGEDTILLKMKKVGAVRVCTYNVRAIIGVINALFGFPMHIMQSNPVHCDCSSETIRNPDATMELTRL